MRIDHQQARFTHKFSNLFQLGKLSLRKKLIREDFKDQILVSNQSIDPQHSSNLKLIQEKEPN